jgi:tetratricopeptide (TPR) repeat protein
MRIARLATLLALAALAASAPSPAGAQPRRPKLAASADTNDWQAYHAFATERLRVSPRDVEAGFYWASRLDPTRAEPYYGRWVAFWLQDLKRFARLLEGDARVAGSADVQRADSLYYVALVRNPFVVQTMEYVLYDMLPGEFNDDAITKARLAYGSGNLQQAASQLERIIRSNPTKHAALRRERALALVPLKRYDEALQEMTALLAELEKRDATRLVRSYASKELVSYGIALLHGARGDVAAAKQAMQQAVVENAAFYPAHGWLGSITLAERDTGTALREFEQAVELAPGDPVMHMGYGNALLQAARPRDAAAEFRRTIAIAPDYADPYFNLAAAHEMLGERAEAGAAYREYLARAPRRDVTRIATARQRATALAAPGTTTPVGARP